jgi:hypothetical protein
MEKKMQQRVSNLQTFDGVKKISGNCDLSISCEFLIETNSVIKTINEKSTCAHKLMMSE